MKYSTIRNTWFVFLLSAAFALSAGTAGARPPGQDENVTYPLPAPTEGAFDEAAAKAIDLRVLPILPDFETYQPLLQAIYDAGQQAGLSPRRFTKIGDCMTASESFLRPIAEGRYDLAEYAYLEPVIAYYRGVILRETFDSFANPSLGAASGFNAPAVLDSTWNDPAYCEAEESPLACELRVSQASAALVMFGTNDLKSLTPAQFNYYLRLAIVETANAGVIPLLATFPNQPGFVDQSIFFNQIVALAAQDYGLPLVNLWRAFEPLPDQGIDPQEPTHMTTPASGDVTSFTEANLSAGHNLHNLLSLQALAGVLETLGLVDLEAPAQP